MNPTALDEVAVTCFCLLERGPSLSRMRGLFSRGVVCRLSLKQEESNIYIINTKKRMILYSIKLEIFGLFKHFFISLLEYQKFNSSGGHSQCTVHVYAIIVHLQK